MIQMRMAFALRLVDDFTGQCIRKKGFLFSVEGRVIHPVEKDEGLYLFMEPQGMDLFPGIYKGKSYRKAFYGRKQKRDSKIYSHGKKRN